MRTVPSRTINGPPTRDEISPRYSISLRDGAPYCQRPIRHLHWLCAVRSDCSWLSRPNGRGMRARDLLAEPRRMLAGRRTRGDAGLLQPASNTPP